MSIDKVPEFKNKGELTKEGKSRPDDFIYNGQKNSEIPKTKGQEKVLNLSKKVILERMEKLGVEPVNDFDLNRVSYIVPVSSNLHSANDFVLLRESAEANVGTNIHELLHAYSSQYAHNEIDSVDDYAKKNKKGIKSGFHINHYKNGVEGDPSSINFWHINEAVTEKITRELMDKNIEEIQKLKPLFSGRYEECVKDYHAKLDKQKIEVAKNVEKIREKLEQDIEEAVQKCKTDIEDITENFKDKNTPKEGVEFLKKSHKEFLDIRIKQLKSFSSLYEKWEKEEIEGLVEIRLNEIKEDYSFEEDREATSFYSKYIKILDLMISGLSYTKSKTEKEFKTGKKEIWNDLQRAYFKGNVMYLRNFDKIYNEKVLRFFNNIGPVHGEKEVKELTNYLKEENEKKKTF